MSFLAKSQSLRLSPEEWIVFVCRACANYVDHSAFHCEYWGLCIEDDSMTDNI